MTNTNAKNLDLYSILAITHHLPIHLTPYLAILEFMTGEKLSAIEWPRAHAECADWLLEQYPQLRDVVMPDFAEGDEAAMDAWADEQKAKFGSTLPVLPLPPGRRAQMSVIDELVNLGVDLNKVYVVDPNDIDNDK